MPASIAEITRRHERRRASALTARERQDWQDVEALLAVDATPADAAGPTIEAARAYLTQPEPPTRAGTGRRPTRRRV